MRTAKANDLALTFSICCGVLAIANHLATWRGARAHRAVCHDCLVVEAYLAREAQGDRDAELIARAREARKVGQSIHDTHVHL